MMMQTSHCRALVPAEANAAILKLMSHARTPADQTSHPSALQGTQRHGPEHTDASPAFHPTPAECYGCVDWFAY